MSLKQTCRFDSLATEVRIKMLTFLDIQTLIQCRLVSRSLKAIVDETAAFQYKIELYAAGMEDGTRADLSFMDKLTLLRKHQTAWDKLQWEDEIDIPPLLDHLFTIRGGVFAVAEVPEMRHFKFWQLPSRLRGIELKTWEISDVGVEFVRDFTMDVSQDLLILLSRPNLPMTDTQGPEAHIHLRRLSDGSSHPRASSRAILDHFQEPEPGSVTTYTFEISGQHLGVLFLSTRGDWRHGELLIWQWTTSNLCLHVEGKELKSFAFLTERLVMLFTVPESNFGGVEPSLNVIDFINTPSKRLSTYNCNCECCFMYPVITGTTIAANSSIGSDPTPMFRPSRDVPFHIGRNQRLYVVTLWVFDPEEMRGCSLFLFVPSWTLLAHVNDPLTAVTKCRRIPWGSWGPANTRMLASPWAMHDCVCFVNGTQYVTLGRQHYQDPQQRATIQIYDFNPASVRRAPSEISDTEEDRDFRIVTEPTVLHLHGLFHDDVTTSLPYRIKSRSVEDHVLVNYAMLSEDNIVLMPAFTDKLPKILIF